MARMLALFRTSFDSALKAPAPWSWTAKCPGCSRIARAVSRTPPSEAMRLLGTSARLQIAPHPTAWLIVPGSGVQRFRGGLVVKAHRL